MNDWTLTDLQTGRFLKQEAAPRFFAKVKEVEGHWLWQGSLNSRGYPEFKPDGKLVKGHRYAYELLVGPIPEGFHVDHVCGNTTCVNPEHLEAVTAQENRMRRDYQGRTPSLRRIEALGKAARRLRYLDYSTAPDFLDEVAEFLTDIEEGRKLVVDTADLEGEKVWWCDVRQELTIVNPPWCHNGIQPNKGHEVCGYHLLIPIPDPQTATEGT